MSNSTPSPRPTPGPRPGPKPGPKPGAGAVRPILPAAEVSVDPAQFGRIDDDGTVYLLTADGERAIASWQAGTAEEGLAHFHTRYQDLLTEVELLEARLGSHPEEAHKTQAAAEELLAGLPEATVIGDIPVVENRLKQVIEHSTTAAQQAKDSKAQRRQEAIARKEALAAEAEEIGQDATNWKQAGDRLRAILEEWKTIRGIDRKTDDVLWKRYSKARDAFNRRRGSHFADLDRNRAQARKSKEELVALAEELKDSTDWNNTARAFSELMQQWKSAGRAPREVDNALWAKFKAAQDHFFDSKNADAKEKDAEFADNAAAKQALLDEYTPLIDPSANLETARTKLHELQDKFDAIGFVPRDQIRHFDEAMGALERKVAEAADSQWRKSDPAAQARVAQFAAKVDSLLEQAEKAESAGRAKKAAELRAQAEQWKEWAAAAENAIT